MDGIDWLGLHVERNDRVRPRREAEADSKPVKTS